MGEKLQKCGTEMFSRLCDNASTTRSKTSPCRIFAFVVIMFHMKFQRFFVKNKAQVGADLVIADPALSHQLFKVLRLKVEETVVLFDGDGMEYVSRIASMRKDGAVFHIEKSFPSIVLPKTILHIYSSLIKKDKLEWVMQKCTEMGAASFHPIIADRSEKLGFDKNRAEKIVREAAEQSGWGRVPEVFAPVKMEMAMESAENPVVLEGGTNRSAVADLFARKLASEDGSSNSPLKQISADLPKNISIFIGPEGGWSESEKEYFSARKIQTLSLGEETLRAETASVAVSALLLLF